MHTISEIRWAFFKKKNTESMWHQFDFWSKTTTKIRKSVCDSWSLRPDLYYEVSLSSPSAVINVKGVHGGSIKNRKWISVKNNRIFKYLIISIPIYKCSIMIILVTKNVSNRTITRYWTLHGKLVPVQEISDVNLRQFDGVENETI